MIRRREGHPSIPPPPPRGDPPPPRFVSASARRCQALKNLLDQEDPRKRGTKVTDRNIKELAVMTVGELRSAAGINDVELTTIFHFLLSQRPSLDGRDEEAYDEAMKEIARALSSRISRNGETTWNPFEGRETTGRQLRGRFYSAALNAGQINASMAFA